MYNVQIYSYNYILIYAYVYMYDKFVREAVLMTTSE